MDFYKIEIFVINAKSLIYANLFKTSRSLVHWSHNRLDIASMDIKSET